MDAFVTAQDSTGHCIAHLPEGVAVRLGPDGPQLADYNPTLSELLPDWED